MNTEKAINKLAESLSVDKKSLIKLIVFESRFDPLARNKISGARGLIQFTHKTAQNLGYKNADDLIDKNRTIEKQLSGPVKKYLSQFKPFGFPFPQSLYLSVFYPSYRYSSPDTQFPGDVRKNNPGINFVRDYIQKVEGIRGKIIFLSKKSFLSIFIPLSLSAALAIGFLNYKKGRRLIYDTRKRGNQGTGIN